MSKESLLTQLTTTDLKTKNLESIIITPPIITPALRLDRLREPALDVLGPVTTEDYRPTVLKLETVQLLFLVQLSRSHTNFKYTVNQ